MTVLDDVLQKVDQDLEASLQRLFDWLKIPSISTDPAYSEDCVTAAHWLQNQLSDLGFKTEVLPTKGHPVVLAHATGQVKKQALFYGHYDVQPVDPLEQWDTPPFEPRMIGLPDGRKAISARGACDDKGQVMTFIEACRAYKAVTGYMPLNLTILVEGEEESGSPNLPAFVEAHRKDLVADVALVCDTGMWDPQTPAITTSLRGLVYEEIVVTCADRDLHSGLFGGAAQNPIRVLSKIIADLHDANGRVALPDFYDGVHEIPSQILEQWKQLDVADFLTQVGLQHTAGEHDRLLIEQIQSRPTCDVNGIIGGYTGEGTKTVIASQASAKISFRLVGDQDPAAISKSFEAFVRARVPADCQVQFIHHKGSRALALPFDMPDLTAARSALQDEWGVPPVTIGSGGSIPIVGDFKRVLGLDTLLVGFGLDDDRVHSPNEKYDLKSFHKGIRSWVRILDALSH
jgi:acetylornithine deacetylase/succinyl-diaminopimelate desuccinylase-like protein